MKSVNNIWLLGILGVVACGSSNQIEISAPNVVSSSIEVISLETGKVMSRKEIKNQAASFSGAELGLEGVELDLDNGLKAIVNEPANFERINVNPITTLAACRFNGSETVSNNELVVAQNKLIAKQFLIDDLHLIRPAMDLENIQSLDSASMYGLLIEGFEYLAHSMNVKSSDLLEALCSDVKFDGEFNEIDRKGSLSNRLNWYDDQLLKSRLADAIYSYAEENLRNFGQLPVAAFVNEISLSAQPGLFSVSIDNYSFDQ